MISPAFAANLSQPSQTSGGAVALAIILSVAVSFYILTRIRKKRRDRLAAGAGGEQPGEQSGEP